MLMPASKNQSRFFRRPAEKPKSWTCRTVATGANHSRRCAPRVIIAEWQVPTGIWVPYPLWCVTLQDGRAVVDIVHQPDETHEVVSWALSMIESAPGGIHMTGGLQIVTDAAVAVIFDADCCYGDSR